MTFLFAFLFGRPAGQTTVSPHRPAIPETENIDGTFVAFACIHTSHALSRIIFHRLFLFLFLLYFYVLGVGAYLSARITLHLLRLHTRARFAFVYLPATTHALRLRCAHVCFYVCLFPFHVSFCIAFVTFVVCIVAVCLFDSLHLYVVVVVCCVVDLFGCPVLRSARAHVILCTFVVFHPSVSSSFCFSFFFCVFAVCVLIIVWFLRLILFLFENFYVYFARFVFRSLDAVFRFVRYPSFVLYVAFLRSRSSLIRFAAHFLCAFWLRFAFCVPFCRFPYGYTYICAWCVLPFIGIHLCVMFHWNCVPDIVVPFPLLTCGAIFCIK